MFTNALKILVIPLCFMCSSDSYLLFPNSGEMSLSQPGVFLHLCVMSSQWSPLCVNKPSVSSYPPTSEYLPGYSSVYKEHAEKSDKLLCDGFIGLYGFGGSILILVQYVLVEAQQQKVWCKDNTLWIFSKQSVQVTVTLMFTARTLLHWCGVIPLSS